MSALHNFIRRYSRRTTAILLLCKGLSYLVKEMAEWRKAHFGPLVNALQKLEKTMATLTERLAGVETSLDEASTEIAEELAKLREELGKVSPEAEAILVRLEAKGAALANIVPNANA